MKNYRRLHLDIEKSENDKMLEIYGFLSLLSAPLVAIHAYRDAPRNFNFFSKLAVFVSAILFAPIFVIFHYFELVKKPSNK
jgi:hypothetical protein